MPQVNIKQRTQVIPANTIFTLGRQNMLLQNLAGQKQLKENGKKKKTEQEEEAEEEEEEEGGGGRGGEEQEEEEEKKQDTIPGKGGV